MKGVSDNNAPKKIKSKGNESELKKPLQVLQLNKKTTSNDTSKNSSTNEKLSNNDESNLMRQKDFDLETEKLKLAQIQAGGGQSGANNTLLYVGLGVLGLLVVGGVIYAVAKK